MRMIESEVRERWGIDSIGSNQQLVRAFKLLDAELIEKTDKGQYKMDKKVLESLTRDHATKELAEKVLQYKAVGKDRDYFKNFLKYADENDVVHPQISPNGAKTGRMSSSKPNFQNLTAKNPRVRNAVIV